MNIGKINVDIVKAIYDTYNKQICAYVEDNESVFITTNGQYGYWLGKNQVLFNLSKVTMLDKKLFRLEDFANDMQEIVPTDNFKKAGKDFIQKFVNKRPYGGTENWCTWINSSFLRPIARDDSVHFFQQFYQGKPSPVRPIMAVQKFKVPAIDL